METSADVLIMALDKISENGPVLVLSHSMGGLVLFAV